MRDTRITRNTRSGKKGVAVPTASKSVTQQKSDPNIQQACMACQARGGSGMNLGPHLILAIR